MLIVRAELTGDFGAQLKDARADNGDRRLPIGQRLPAGQRHGWGSYAGYEAPMGTTRDMGEYRLVFVSHDKTQQGGSQSPAMGKGSPALGGGGGGELLGGKKDVLDVASQAEAHGKSPTPTIIASETARNMYQSFKQQSLERAWAGASTPDLVEAINDLRMTEMQRHGQSTGQRQGEGGAGQAGGPKSHSVPLSTERSSAGDRTVLPYVLPSGSRRVTQVGGPAGGNLSPTEWEGYHRSMQRVKKLQELKEGPEARLSYRGGRLVLAASHENTPTKTEIIDKMSPVVTRRNPAEAVELHFKKMAIKKVQREREIKEGKRRKRKGH